MGERLGCPGRRPESMLDDWQPRQFLASVSEMDMDSFLTSFEGTHFLLVDIEDASDRLISGLFHTSPLVRHDTPLVEELTGATDIRLAREDSFKHRGRTGRIEAVSIAHDILADRGMQSRFLAPIRRRLGSAGERGVTVGRNLGNDVILKHQSISRFHARFDHKEGAAVTLVDLGSKNGIWVNAERLEGERVLSNGDSLRLGQIEALFCDAEVLWQLVHPEFTTEGRSARR